MVVRTVSGHRVGEYLADLEAWLRALPADRPLHRTVPLACPADSHDEPATWCYVEADPAAGAVRRRCLACARVTATLDSEAHWTHPGMWSCEHCGQSIAELAAGLHLGPDERVRWVVIGARCVGCGDLSGLTDITVAGRPLDDVLTAL